ncbi:MAG: DUF1269 domain-containing protein [Anaerolineae bacterium]|nr:DUF1269 domain-containing protein [Anaerolineae bacterium]
MGQTPLQLVVYAYANENEAQEALRDMQELQRAGTLRIVNAAVLVKDEKGRAIIRETEDISATRGALFGAIAGALIGLLGGPGGAIVGAAAGAAAGGAAAHTIDMGFDDGQLQALQGRLTPGTSAIIALVEHDWVGRFAKAMEEKVVEHEAELFRVALEAEIMMQLEEQSRQAQHRPPSAGDSVGS